MNRHISKSCEASDVAERKDIMSTGRITLHLRQPCEARLPRELEPVAWGIPFARGVVSLSDKWELVNSEQQKQCCQTKAVGLWPDGSVRWLSLCFYAGLGRDQQSQDLQLRLHDSEKNRSHQSPDSEKNTSITSNAAAFHPQFSPAPGYLLSLGPEIGPQRVLLSLSATTDRGRERAALIQEWSEVSTGPVCATVAFRGRFRHLLLGFLGEASFYSAARLIRLTISVENPARARHKGGYWDLGDPASVLLRELSLRLALPRSHGTEIQWIESPGDPQRSCRSPGFRIWQESSGGENWKSRNHVNRRKNVPLKFRGYRIDAGGELTSGLRASPVVAIRTQYGGISCALTDFWQRFPSAIEVHEDLLRVGFLPACGDDLHEIQPGERHTRVIWFELDGDSESACERLAWVHKPLIPLCDLDVYYRSGAIPFLPGPGYVPRSELQTVVAESLDGLRNFFWKREAIDEYGWRNFGDLWADHEEAYCDATSPVISHYNNQYDALHSFLIQYLVTGDNRWWELADPLARHILDIDLYHTDRDKSTYSGGLFWHTAHYHDAGTCTHRSMSRMMMGQEIPAHGGGPSNEHNYTSGLLLFYFLTGNPRARDAVIQLAEWVDAMDDGRQHLLGIVSDAATGAATSTTQTTYHGPGRGAGNSINALLDAWQLTRSKRYVDKIAELIRRTVHPADDIEARELRNAELRWSYTVYLQSLARFIALTRGLEGVSELREYARRSLMHYARWMSANERLYLDAPEELEYPTETWAAQDLRKGTVLLMAGLLCDDQDRAVCQRRGRELLDGAWQRLLAYPTRNYTRPLVLALQQGYLETHLTSIDVNYQQDRDCVLGSVGAEQPRAFETQKQLVQSQLKSIRGSISVALRAAQPVRWGNVWRRSWAAQVLRQLLCR